MTMEFKDMLKAARKNKGITQEELAETLSVSRPSVSKWERGLAFPDISILLPLADALGMPAGLLVCSYLLQVDSSGLARTVFKRDCGACVTRCILCGCQGLDEAALSSEKPKAAKS